MMNKPEISFSEEEVEDNRKISYNNAIEDCLVIFLQNTFDIEHGNTYIQDIIKKFKAIKYDI